LDPEHCRIIQ